MTGPSFPCAYCGKVLPKSEFPVPHFAECAECRTPQLTPAQVDAEAATFDRRTKAFAARYPWAAWVGLLVVTPWLWWLAWRESRKTKC